MAFPSIDGTNESAQTSATNTVVVTLPTGIVANDLLVVIMAKGGDATPGAINALAGWSELVDEAVVRGAFVAYRWADGTEGATVTFTAAGTATRRAHISYRISGASNPATQVPQISAVATGTSQVPNPNIVTPTGGAKDYLWLTFFTLAGEEADDDTWTNAAATSFSGLLQKTSGTGGTNVGANLAVSSRIQNAASQDAVWPAAAVDQSLAWRAFTIAIHPAGMTTQAITPGTMTATPVAVVASAPSVVAVTPGTLTLSTTPQVLAKPFTASITASGDDAWEDADGSINVDSAGILNDATGDWMAFRFQLVDIPRAPLVTSATLTLVLTDSDKNDAEGTWYCEAIDHSATFTVAGAGSNQISGRTRTTASVAWTTNDLGIAGAAVVVSGLGPLIQEVVNRPGWAPNNALTLIYDHNSGTDKIQVASWDHATAAAPKLEIVWAEPLAAALTPGQLTASPVAMTATIGVNTVAVPQRHIVLPGAAGAYVSTADRAALDVSALDAEAHFWNPGNSPTAMGQAGVMVLDHHADFNLGAGVDPEWLIEYTVDAGVTSPPLHAGATNGRLFTKHTWGIGESWRAYFLPNGDLGISWQTSGAVFRGVTYIGLWAVGHQAHKFWLDIDDGAGNWVMHRYTSDSGTLDGPWTEQATVTGTGQGPTDIITTTEAITLGGDRLGYETLSIKINGFEFRAGHDGTAVARLRAKDYAAVPAYNPADDGYEVTFFDDFPGSSLSSNWIDHPPWQPVPPAGSITVADSVVRIRSFLSGGEIPINIILTGPGGGSDPTQEAIQLGYLEARLRYSDSPWSWPAFWMLSTAWMDLYPNYETDPAGCPAGNRNSEIDMFDGGGLKQVVSAVHSNTSSPCGVPDTSRLSLATLDVDIDDSAGRLNDWHVYGCRWTTTYVYFYFDGQLIGALPAYASNAQTHNIWCSAQWYSSGVLADVLGYDPVPPKPTETWTDVDWVRVWQLP